jgi:3-oxoacyl-[acyl-carrier protein] reductase
VDERRTAAAHRKIWKSSLTLRAKSARCRTSCWAIALKQVLITGASRGIGAAIALEMGTAGYRVWLHYRARTQEARDVAAGILRAGGPEPHLVAFDLADRQAAESATQKLLEEMGTPEAVVFNAGITANALFALTDDAQWDAVFATNVGGFLAVGRPVVKAMVRERRGRIVLLSSIAAQRGNAGQVAYAASKGALLSAARSLARELAPRGITVNAVSPGLIETEMLEGAPLEALVPRVPLGRVGTPREVAHVVRYLCSDEAAFLTGQVIGVDGGLWT